MKRKEEKQNQMKRMKQQKEIEHIRVRQFITTCFLVCCGKSPEEGAEKVVTFVHTKVLLFVDRHGVEFKFDRGDSHQLSYPSEKGQALFDVHVRKKL